MRRAVAVTLLAVLAMPAAALAHASPRSGGARYSKPEVKTLKCGTGEQTSCPRGYVLRLSGENLAQTRTVIFLGARGSRDDRRARPEAASPHRVLVTVPASARSGRLRVLAADSAAAGPRLRVLPPAVAPPATAPVAALPGVFPVQGAHDYGSEINRFGGPRRHQGQDVLAACGTPLVAALAGQVTLTRFHARAGNYVVIKADDGTSQAYMHLLAPAAVEQGQRVSAGQPLGQVGQTGAASACHLHFELWTAPGWHEGGEPVDPLALLQAWDTPR